jgi:glycerol kinase
MKRPETRRDGGFPLPRQISEERAMGSEKFIGAIDQGTTSTRFILFNHQGQQVASAQEEHRQIYPQPGWVEHDPREIIEKTGRVITAALKKAGITPSQVEAVGITNQRETTLVWDPSTGEPLHNALVWQDTRTGSIVEELSADGGQDRLRGKTGLPLATYFAGPKMKWLLDNVPGLRKRGEEGRAVFGTVDTWVIWNLTGGPRKGSFVTDVTNASRTMLMNLHTMEWDQELLDLFTVPRGMLPEIRSSVAARPYGTTLADGPFGGEIPLTGILGDQQAAMFGQACFKPGMGKNTYGTGCFLLSNIGETPTVSRYGLLTTALYRIGQGKPVYALEGSIAVAGSLVQWVRDNLGLISTSAEIESLAAREKDSGGVYIVPAFAGLFAPHWRPDARGIVSGLTGYANRSHIARAVLESTAFQTREIVEAMEKDSGSTLTTLKVDGGMVVNELLMQFQADILNIPVIRPRVTETTALGAAYAAGLSVGFWQDLEEIASQWAEDKRWLPSMEEAERAHRYRYWMKAVERTMNWQD